jgi:hypothetical protein
MAFCPAWRTRPTGERWFFLRHKNGMDCHNMPVRRPTADTRMAARVTARKMI